MRFEGKDRPTTFCCDGPRGNWNSILFADWIPIDTGDDDGRLPIAFNGTNWTASHLDPVGIFLDDVTYSSPPGPFHMPADSPGDGSIGSTP